MLKLDENTFAYGRSLEWIILALIDIFRMVACISNLMNIKYV